MGTKNGVHVKGRFLSTHELKCAHLIFYVRMHYLWHAWIFMKCYMHMYVFEKKDFYEYS